MSKQTNAMLPMSSRFLFTLLPALIVGMLFSSGCIEAPVEPEPKVNTEAENITAFTATMEKHLAAISTKNLDSLASTMSPEGDMQLMLGGMETIVSVDSFMSFHETWFREPNWTFDTEILNIEVGERVGMAIVESMYREPERDGKPYFNRMTISYVLRKINNKWYVIKDHATSVEKSTDS